MKLLLLVLVLGACEGGDVAPPPPAPPCWAVCNPADIPPQCDDYECVCQLWNHHYTHCTVDPHHPDARL